MNRKVFAWLGIVTLFGFSALGIWLVEAFQEVPFRVVFFNGWPWWQQLGVGLVYGLASGMAAWWLLQRKWMREMTVVYAGLFSSLELSMQDILFISLAAGVGEEILFRAGVQPFLGIWGTSILFVAIHGYLDPRKWRVMVYGTAMTLIIAGIGWMFEHVGLVSCMVAHFTIDVYLLVMGERYPMLPSEN